jgi:hypothetical protein
MKKKSLPLVPHKQSASATRPTTDKVRSCNDAKEVAVLLGAQGGVLDEHNRPLLAIQHAWAVRFPNIPCSKTTLLCWLTDEGVPSLVAKDMSLPEICRRLKGAIDPTATSKPRPELLTDAQQAAYDLIASEGPLQGNVIVKRLGIGSESAFTTHYVPALKRHGVKNRRGAGYYLP